MAGLAGGLPGGAGGGGGLFQLVPQLGPLVSAVLGALVGFSASPGTGLAVLGTYYLVQRLVGAFVGSRVERRVSDLHPTILVLVIVALSQLGWQWIFLAAPAVARDLWRYAFERLGDPRRAGALPGAESTEAPSRRGVCWRPARCRWSTVGRRKREGHGAGAKRPGRAPADPGPVPLEEAAEAFARRRERAHTHRCSRSGPAGSARALLAGAVALAVGIALGLLQERVDLLLLAVLVAAVLVALGSTGPPRPRPRRGQRPPGAAGATTA